jgi:succinyl-diaminopimelate desuccinylase
MSEEDILQIIDRYQESAVTLLGHLIEANSVNPPGNEHTVADVLSKEFERLGVEFSVHEKVKGRTNIAASIGSGQGPVFTIVCHSDTVPAGEGWISPPFKATVKNGRVYGRGAADDKGPLASAVLALEALKEADVKLSGKLVVLAAADEEKGSIYGVDYLLKEVKPKPDLVMVAEQTSAESLEIAEKGNLWLKLKSTGVQAHASTPKLGVNAIQKLSKILATLDEFRMGYISHPVLGGPTLNIGTVKGGTATNVVAGSAEAILDIRYVPGQTPERIMEELESFIESEKERDPKMDVTVEKLASMPPTEVPTDSILVKVTSEAVRAVTGKEPKLIGIGGATVAKSYLANGIPAIMYGPGDARLDHVANEYIELYEVMTAAKVMAITALKLLTKKR